MPGWGSDISCLLVAYKPGEQHFHFASGHKVTVPEASIGIGFANLAISCETAAGRRADGRRTMVNET